MKFKNYLIENQEDKINEMIYLIKKDCQPFLKEWHKINKGPLLTGRKNEKSFNKKQVRKNRKPRDTPEELHKLVDEWFYKKFKLKLRSNSIFSTFSYRIVGVYGVPYCVFPIGDYTIISSEEIKDLYNNIDYLFYKKFSDSVLTYNDLSEEKQKEFQNILLKHLEKSNYKKGLRYHDNEQMINCKEYYILSYYIYNNTRIKDEI
jgi:hypothetical protein